MNITDVGVIYSALLSTTTALIGGGRWLRHRKIDLSFSYGWEETQGHHAKLSVRVHNNSPSATIHLLQIGWKSPDGFGDFWNVPDASIAVNSRTTYTHDFVIGNPPSTLAGTVLLGDRSQREGHLFNVPQYHVSDVSDDLMIRGELPRG
jgi:hypothetical protein